MIDVYRWFRQLWGVFMRMPGMPPDAHFQCREYEDGLQRRERVDRLQEQNRQVRLKDESEVQDQFLASLFLKESGQKTPLEDMADGEDWAVEMFGEAEPSLPKKIPPTHLSTPSTSSQKPASLDRVPSPPSAVRKPRARGPSKKPHSHVRGKKKVTTAKAAASRPALASSDDGIVPPFDRPSPPCDAADASQLSTGRKRRKATAPTREPPAKRSKSPLKLSHPDAPVTPGLEPHASGVGMQPRPAPASDGASTAL